MATLPINILIPHGVARRIATQFDLEYLSSVGTITSLTLPAVLATQPPEGCRDEHAFAADRRALAAYVAAVGTRSSPAWWSSVWSTDVVPWAYGR